MSPSPSAGSGGRQDGAGPGRAGSAVRASGAREKSKGGQMKARDGRESGWHVACAQSPGAKRARSEFRARQSSAVGQCVAWWHILCQPTPQVPVTGVSALSTQGIFAKCHQCCHPKATARKGSPGSVPHCKGCVVPKPHFALLFLQFFPSPGNSTCAARAHGEQAARPRSANNQRELGTQPRVTAPLP